MDLNAKIQQILINKGLSSSQFADAIGVTRSGISHILSGRNRPSLDLVQKIIVQYPELGTAWILDSESLPESFGENSLNDVLKEAEENLKPLPKPIINEIDKVTKIGIDSLDIPDKEKGVPERVLIFFKNGTFKEYLPL